MNPSFINKIENFFERRYLMAIFLFVLIGITIFIRAQIYLNVSLNLIDSDQPFMWAGAVDYAKGVFHEPRFYGQNYNTFFEGLMAVPLIWIGLPVYKALPIATQFLFLFPFLFASVYLFLKGNKRSALLVLCILLCLPTAFDIMTSLPRGFITGICFSSFFAISFCNPNNFKWLVVNFVLLMIGYFINPNSILISAPFLVYLFQFHYKHKRFYLLSASMLMLFLALYYVFDGFYKRHPDYIVYGYEHSFALKHFIQNIKHLDQSFAYVSFFKEGNSWIFLLSLIVLGYYLFKKNKNAFIAFISFVAVILLSFFSEKSRDGVVWPWYAYSRLYICAPAVLFLFASLFNFKKSLFAMIFVFISIFFSSYKILSFDSNLKRLTNEKLWNGVHLVSMQSTLDAMKFFKSECQKNRVAFFLISNGFWLNTYLDYGGPAIDKDFPQTYETRAERRFWVRATFDNKVVDRFIFISAMYDFETKAAGPFEIKKLDDYGLYLIEKNQITTKQFIDLANKIELGK